MSYDLLEEKWIPVRCKSGARRFIAPWQIAEVDDPPVDIDTGRPDFDCAGIQFLIGLLQTAFTPPDEASWRSLHDEPPTAMELRDWLAPLRGKFELLGDGPRFMQDWTLAGRTDLEPRPVYDLLVDAPGENTNKYNKDLFSKRWFDPKAGLSPAASAFALLSAQYTGLGVGPGFYVGVRGGGPLNTLISGENIWLQAWRNVLDAGAWRNGGSVSAGADHDRFPWFHKHADPKYHVEVNAETVAPEWVFWAMPQRRYLTGEVFGSCQLFPELGDVQTFTGILTANKGFDHKNGCFDHPLSPYRTPADSPPTSIKGSRRAVSFAEWPALFLGGTSGQRISAPARVIRRWRMTAGLPEVSITLAGFDANKAKAEAWCHGRVPALSVLDAHVPSLFSGAAALVAAAEFSHSQLAKAFASAWFESDRARDGTQKKPSAQWKQIVQGERGEFHAERDRLADRLFAGVEPRFYTAVRQLHQAIVGGADTPDDPIQATLRTAWCQTLHTSALALFDEASQLLGQWESADIRRIAEARKWLMWHTKPDGDAMLIHVGLKAPDLEAKPKSKRAKGAK